MSQALKAHNSLKWKKPALPTRHRDKEGDLSGILEITSALNISGERGSFFDLGFPRILCGL